jgi:murein L,D-transpeptidase YcbB/YkuD
MSVFEARRCKIAGTYLADCAAVVDMLSGKRREGVRLIYNAFLPLALLFTLVPPVQAQAPSQLQNGVVEQIAILLESEENLALHIRKKKASLKTYYLEEKGTLLWIGNERMPRLIQLMLSAESQGLFASDYPTEYLQKLLDAVPQTDEKSRAIVELLYSSLFLKFSEDLKGGRLTPRKVDLELYWRTKEIDLTAALRALAKEADFNQFIAGWEPNIPDYKALKVKLALYREFEKNHSWPKLPSGEVLKPGMDDPRIPILRKRLAGARGTKSAQEASTAVESTVYDEALVKAVKHFQELHGLEPDGVIGLRTKVALNIPIEERVRQIIVSMERWRWMPEELGRDYIKVNIAGFHLTRYENGQFAERKKVIVGKPYRRTPAFSDTIKYLEFNPYWTVPYSIATRDKLPVLQKNPSALVASGFEVFSGKQRVDPRTVNWQQYSRASFPFTLRQNPGPKNALGQVKFMFPNRFNVYLHDTPNRKLFDKTFRSFSSGCVRVHKPIDFAEALLKQKQGWDRARIDGVLASGKRTVVKLDKPLPIHIIYSTAWLAEDGTIRFYVDFYQRDDKLYQALFGKPVPWRGG